MNCSVSNDSTNDYGDCEGSIDELKVPQLYPSVRRDDTVRKLHVWCINKHLNHYLSDILVYLHAGSLQQHGIDRRINTYLFCFNIIVKSE